MEHFQIACKQCSRLRISIGFFPKTTNDTWNSGILERMEELKTMSLPSNTNWINVAPVLLFLWVLERITVHLRGGRHQNGGVRALCQAEHIQGAQHRRLDRLDAIVCKNETNTQKQLSSILTSRTTDRWFEKQEGLRQARRVKTKISSESAGINERESLTISHEKVKRRWHEHRIMSPHHECVSLRRVFHYSKGELGKYWW